MAWFGRRQQTTTQRADCPHRPHDAPCGPVHPGPCVVAHQGACAATHPRCPACHADAFRVHVPAVVAKVHAHGEVISACSACEQRSFRYDAELVCVTCDWLVPDVNDRLAARFEANGGPFAAAPGVCAGCGQTGAGPSVSFPITCPTCGAGGRVPQEVVNPRLGVRARCSSTACGAVIVVPPEVWCPDCKLNLRTLSRITELVAAANRVG